MNKIWTLIALAEIFSGQVFCQTSDLESLVKCLIRIKVNKTEIHINDSTEILEEDYSQGTGIYISETGLFITAEHIIRNRNKKSPSPIGCTDNIIEESFGATIIYEDYENDVALLQNPVYTEYHKVNKYFINLNNCSELPTKVGTKIYSFGYPNELRKLNKIYAFSMGKIISKNTDLEGHEVLPYRANVSIADCSVVSGFSGGIITDYDYKPIGLILGSIIEKNRRLTYFKSLAQIKKIMENHDQF